MLKVGDKAPKFALYDTDLKLRELKDFLDEGQRTILAFYPGAFTGVCTKEMCEFRDMHGELQKMKAKTVGISVDPPFANKAFAEKYGLTFPLLSDFKREAIRDYDVVWKDLGGMSGYDGANRAVFVVDGSGRIVYSWVGENPGKYPDFGAIRKSL
ncbi:MAG: redoxin domain-containing protein [Nitrososphaerota archaeon]|jgi:peroxiredoxin|nr:redoxin domain-containing protein [Nitrososphaerota archaeon]MDG6943114.1 redoxin domain-containing protein [Nitrososphaerota archaeon]MDG6951008.1 redoxin domain-containing protein [Nitrososphaerota archaeon]